MHVRRKAKITSKGQLTLPADVRRALSLHPGDTVDFDIGPEGVTIAPDRAAERFAAFAGKYRAGRGRSIAEIDGWLRGLRGSDK